MTNYNTLTTHFTHIRRRMIRIKPSIGNDNNNEEPITLVVDASGLTTSKKGDYIEEKWIRNKKEFIKLHIAVDAKSKKLIKSTRSSILSYFLNSLCVGSCSICSPSGVALIILLEVNVLPDPPCASSIALFIECDIVLAKIQRANYPTSVIIIDCIIPNYHIMRSCMWVKTKMSTITDDIILNNHMANTKSV